MAIAYVLGQGLCRKKPWLNAGTAGGKGFAAKHRVKQRVPGIFFSPDAGQASRVNKGTRTGDGKRLQALLRCRCSSACVPLIILLIDCTRRATVSIGTTNKPVGQRIYPRCFEFAEPLY